MRGISNLFGRSPFVQVLEHGRKVDECVTRLAELFRVLFDSGDRESIEKLALEVAELETEADTIRNQIHEALSGKLLFPIGRAELFDFVEQQDSMADRAEEIAVSFTFRSLALPEAIAEDVMRFVEIVLQNCSIAAGVVSKLDLLIESSFAQLDAKTVLKLINELRGRDDLTRDAGLAATRTIFAAENSLSSVELILWVKIMGLLEDLSHFADSTANGLRIVIGNQRN